MTRQGRRYIRTVLLGVVALGALVWMAIDQFGISRDVMLELLLLAAGVVLAVIACAGATALLWIGLRSWWSRRDP